MTGTVFIGYDAREHDAALVAAYSLRRRSTTRLRVYALEHRLLRSLGLFTRPWKVDSKGQFHDERDGKPFSTEFSHSRFLVFHLAQALKCQGPCLFVDCDWLFQADISELLEETANAGESIGVVQRERKVEEGSLKMDGMVQQNYERKLWSALFAFMPTPDLAELFSPDTVNNAPGRQLHRFCGLGEGHFWRVDPAWHYIPSLDERPNRLKGVHFSEFSPWLNPEKFSQSPAEFWAWEDELHNVRRSMGQSLDLRLFDDLKHDLVQAAA